MAASVSGPAVVVKGGACVDIPWVLSKDVGGCGGGGHSLSGGILDRKLLIANGLQRIQLSFPNASHRKLITGVDEHNPSKASHRCITDFTQPSLGLDACLVVR